MKLVILEDVESVAKWSASYIIDKINNFNSTDRRFVLGLPTGTDISYLRRSLWSDGGTEKNLKIFYYLSLIYYT